MNKETNLEKAKRKIRDSSNINGFELAEDGLIFKMLDLASEPNDNVRENLINEIETNLKIQKTLWKKAKEWQYANERYLYGRYMSYKELSDGLKNGFFTLEKGE